MIVHPRLTRQNAKFEPSPTAKFTEPVVEGFRRITNKPIRAVICSLAHPEHVGGARIFVTEEQVHSGGFKIVALAELNGPLARTAGCSRRC